MRCLLVLCPEFLPWARLISLYKRAFNIWATGGRAWFGWQVLPAAAAAKSGDNEAEVVLFRTLSASHSVSVPFVPDWPP